MNREVISDSNREESLFANRALKRQQLSSTIGSEQYKVPTSNICEWLISVAGYALDSKRMGLLPPNLESQLVLNLNGDLWDVRDVDKVMKQ